MRSLTRLPQTNFSGLDYDNLMQDIINLVQDNPDYNESWESFLSADAGRMLIELFAYISDQLATRVDWVGNENFIGTATQKASVMRILKIIGYNFTLPISASVDVGMTVDDWSPIQAQGDDGFYLTTGYENGDTGWQPFSITATDKAANIKTFELLDYNVNTGAYNYTTSIYMLNDFEIKKFYEGQTVVDTFTAETDNNPIFTLTQLPVTENSILVRLIGDSGGSVTESNLLQVTSFLDPDAQNEEYSDGTPIPIPYILNVEENDTVTVEFGATSLLSSSTRRLAEEQQIRVIYRMGGGKAGNIVKQAINSTKNILVPLYNDPNTSVQLFISFINSNSASGGLDGESTEHASIYAPLQIRTVDKAVTSEDYSILLEAHENVITSKSYGGFNMPSNTYDVAGLYIRPMETWNYIVPTTSGYDAVNPSEYNYFQWMTFRTENRFNGIYDFTEGLFNSKVSISNSDIHIGDSFIDWWGDTNYTFYQEAGLSFYNGDTESGCTNGDSYSFVVNGDSYKITIATGDSTHFGRVVYLMNDARAVGDSWIAAVVGDTDYMDIRVSLTGDTWVLLGHPDGDTLWTELTGFTDFDAQTSDNYGDTFRNFIIISTPQSMITSLQNCLQGDSFFRLKTSYTEDTTQQFRNIPTVCGDSLLGDSAPDSRWRIFENINAYLQSSKNVEIGIDMSTNYKMELSADGDTYITIDLKNGAVDPFKVRAYEIMYNINRTFFEDSGYGDSGDSTGDTSYGDSTGLTGVASVIEGSGGVEYIRLQSPKDGDSSKISIRKLSQYDIGDSIFGDYISGDTGDSFHCYGIKKLTAITNVNIENFGKLIYEPATLNLSSDEDALFMHYLNSNENSIYIGDYFYNNYSQGADLQWRKKATRIYNSYFATSGDSTVTINSSEFQLKFTKGSTKSTFLWSIGDSWNLSIASAARINGDTNLGDTLHVPPTKRYLKINVDNKGDTIIDLWGQSTPGDSHFDPDDIMFNLNTHLQNSYSSFGMPYNNYTYFTVVQNKTLLKSPTITNSSLIKIMPTSNDGAPILLGSSFGGGVKEYAISGDYYLEYDSVQNMMKLTKTTDSLIPDLDFYCHFIYDRRFEPSGNLTEDTYTAYLKNKKIIGVENVFKQTKFSTFDLKGTIHYNSAYTVGQVTDNVKRALTEEYSLLNSSNENKRMHEQKIFRSKVDDLIQGVPGVEWIEIEYFGKDVTDFSTADTNYINCNFDEIIVLSEDVRDQNNVQTHGLLFRYELVSD